MCTYWQAASSCRPSSIYSPLMTIIKWAKFLGWPTWFQAVKKLVTRSDRSVTRDFGGWRLTPSSSSWWLTFWCILECCLCILCSEWIRMDPNGSEWIRMDPNGNGDTSTDIIDIQWWSSLKSWGIPSHDNLSIPSHGPLAEVLKPLITPETAWDTRSESILR